MPDEILEECLSEMGTPKTTKKRLGISHEAIPMENVKLAYEQATNKSWDEEYEEE